MNKEMEPLRQDKEQENNLYPNISNAGEAATTSANFHNIKF
jgi:hypothetical protein